MKLARISHDGNPYYLASGAAAMVFVAVSGYIAAPAINLGPGTAMAEISASISQVPGPAPPVPSVPPPPTTDPGLELNASAADLSNWLSHNPAVTTSTAELCDPAPDLVSGQLAQNGLAFMREIVQAGFTLRLSCIMTGHAKDGKFHPQWKAYDISMINGESVGPGKPETVKFINWLFARSNHNLPFEVGGPFVGDQAAGGRTKWLVNGQRTGGPFFTDDDHQTHFHMGFAPSADGPSGGWY